MDGVTRGGPPPLSPLVTQLITAQIIGARADHPRTLPSDRVWRGRGVHGYERAPYCSEWAYISVKGPHGSERTQHNDNAVSGKHFLTA